MKRIDLIIFSSIYSVAFTIVLWYGLNHNLVNDGVKEYQTYLANIKEGWHYRQTLVNSCLITTWIPAMIYKIVGHGQIFIFRLIPALFYPLMPAFTYLIAKRYVKTSYAVVSALVILTSSFFIYFPDIGRVGVALGFFAGMTWALLERKIAWSIIFAVLLVFAHYATGLVALSTLLMTITGYFVWKHQILKQYVAISLILISLIGIWHFGIAGYSGEIMWQSLSQQPYTNYDHEYSGTDNATLPQKTPDILDPATREPAVQQAIGLNFDELPLPAKIELAVNWLVVMIITIGLFVTLKRKRLEFSNLPKSLSRWVYRRDNVVDDEFKVLSLSLFALILATVAIPWLSSYYGAMRVYFTASILLAICFPVGAEWLSDKLYLPKWGLIGAVLILYALSTSGIVYHFFGLAKTFPVVVQLIP